MEAEDSNLSIMTGDSEAEQQGREGISVIKDGKYSDLTITLADCNVSYKVHKIYLALASSVLEALIDDLRWGEELVLEEGSPEAFLWLLRFIYGCDPPMESNKLAVNVACLVGRYKVKALHPICLEWLDNILKRDTVLEVYNAAYILKNTLLVTKCLQLLLTCTDQVLASPQVCCLAEDAFTFLLGHSLCVKSEAVILNAAIAWGRERLPADQKASGAALHHKLRNVLPHVRILTLSAEEIVQGVMASGVYSPEECQAILMHRTQTAGAPPLPETCCTLLTKRKSLDAFPLSHVRLPGSRNSTLLPGELAPNQELVLVSGLRVDAPVVLQRVEGRGVLLREVTAAVKDTAGRTLYTAAMHEGVFDVPVALDPDKVCTLMAKIREDEWYYHALYPFTAGAAGVHFNGEHAFLSEGCDLYFWRLDQYVRVDL
ncbi:BTB/POZ domain-containing protein 6-like [Portunus trituberculatus]|uniref:BTB/POZ domain-containing protein 6-like n=1 Tax=Portunus trituberculatus TaxID=210409 RepID=UPI001E1CE6D7|nr:BTB/POZ domain-containing protein 6-like [Portunus trituberculatus]